MSFCPCPACGMTVIFGVCVMRFDLLFLYFFLFATQPIPREFEHVQRLCAKLSLQTQTGCSKGQRGSVIFGSNPTYPFKGFLVNQSHLEQPAQETGFPIQCSRLFRFIFIHRIFPPNMPGRNLSEWPGPPGAFAYHPASQCNEISGSGRWCESAPAE